jgi:hypothetical protein
VTQETSEITKRTAVARLREEGVVEARIETRAVRTRLVASESAALAWLQVSK